MNSPQVALSKDFLEALTRLPKAQQRKVREFTEKFQRDPLHPSINLEQIHDFRDSKLRSVRIDQAYRAIVAHPPKGDVWVLVWVDHHDEAYRWARNKRLEVNPLSGAFQLYDLERATDQDPLPREHFSRTGEGKSQGVAEPTSQNLFAAIDDEDLLLAGVPLPLLASVRAVATETDLDALAAHLPADCSEMLYLLAAGYSLTDALEESARSRPTGTIDTDNFAAALARPESQQQFKVIADEAELDEILNAPLEKWRIFLHPSQRKLVEMNANGPVRVLGSAGTGKTVVLMHRARHLALRVFTAEQDRILVTTYTRNLAADLAANLRNLCGSACERLEVVNLHSWAIQFMRRHNCEFSIVQEDERRRLFGLALAEADNDRFSHAFYEQEWDEVIQDQEVTTLDDYITARRLGRGTRLNRAERVGVWRVFDRYRELLRDEGKVEWEDVIRETRLFMERNKLDPGYKAVLADEVQDFTAPQLRLLRLLAPEGANSLFVVGDGHQRIYGKPKRLSSFGIDIRGRSRRLKLNYRTTEEIRNHAIAVLEGCTVDDLDGGTDTLRGYRSLRRGTPPQLRLFAKESEEAAFVVETVRRWLADEVPAESICISARTNALLKDRYQKLLKAAVISSVIVTSEPDNDARKPGVRLATMQRMKGLEFSKVILAGIQKGTFPLEVGGLADEASRQDHELQERCLFYVGATRARDDLVVTGYGEPSHFVP
ncbi:MAG TPA: UvrD-helicase domain-containing protein [Terriglobales bacterium]|nr:UvrD-helicase domain-containing protein [Terriglobales bacterium]